jgi:hAT family C-terminal dimerisation region
MYKDEPTLFWQLHHDDSRALYQLAYRIHCTLANSVPSERAFSAINLTHTKLRSKLAPERVDKLLYVQINRRVLRRDLHATRKQADEEEVIIEDVDMEDI